MNDSTTSDLASLKIDRDAPVGSDWRRKAGVLIAITVLGGLAMAGSLSYLRATVFRPEVDLTAVLSVSPTQSKTGLTATGYVVPQVVSRIGAKVPGRVARVYVRQGDHVEEGHVLFELERADQEAALHAAKSKTWAARARAATARANVAETMQQARRQRVLADKGVAPAALAEDLEARQAALQEAARAAAAEVRAAEAEVATIEVDLEHMTIEAPITGTVVNKPPEVGEVLTADTNSKTVELADFNTLMVEVDIPEGRLHLVTMGAPCEIVLDAFPDRRFRGEAAELSPRVDRAKATAQVKVRFVSPMDGVLPDMSARVAFLREPLNPEEMNGASTRIVPANAVAERGGAPVVFVVNDGRVHMETVELGERTGSGFELVRGPQPGTQLVRDPDASLRDGQVVKPRTDE